MSQEFGNEKELKTIEYLILLILGKAGGRVSALHLQKIFFFLWKFHPEVRWLVEFVPHLKGPFSDDLDDAIKNPIYVVDCWKYVPPKSKSKAEKAMGGYLVMTRKGEETYKKLAEGLRRKAQEDKDALALLSAVELIVPLYTRLSWDELLFLLYTDETNKEYSIKSELSHDVLKNAENIVNRLVKKGIITEDMKPALLQRAKRARWIL